MTTRIVGRVRPAGRESEETGDAIGGRGSREVPPDPAQHREPRGGQWRGVARVTDTLVFLVRLLERVHPRPCAAGREAAKEERA